MVGSIPNLRGKEVKSMEKFCTGTRGGWVKHEANPVLGGKYGVCFDISVLQKEDVYRMYFSWRTKKSVAVTDSRDGLEWSEPQICIEPRESAEGWENDINRPSVVYRDGVYHLWYTGQLLLKKNEGVSHIFYARSTDGVHFERRRQPVLSAEYSWEKKSVMNPDVMWDETEQIYRMWYSGGEQYEPDAIGYATSRDGIHWDKFDDSPVFRSDPENDWEQQKVAGCHVVKVKDDYIMFYIGYHNEDYAQIGMAKSPNGYSDWSRYGQNPIIAPDPGKWDGDACYKPFVLYDGEKWMLWYNGRCGHVEEIGVAMHEGFDLF